MLRSRALANWKKKEKTKQNEPISHQISAPSVLSGRFIMVTYQYIHYYNSTLIQSVGPRPVARRRLSSQTEHWVWCDDPRMAARRDPGFWIKFLLQWFFLLHNSVHLKVWITKLLFKSVVYDVYLYNKL